MLDNSDDLTSIVVLEAGAAWPSWLTDYQRLAPNAVVIAQAASEAMPVFRARVLHRIAEAANTNGARVRVGVIVAADHPHQQRPLLRESIARALLAVMGKSHEAELVLAGNSDELEASRHELFALAGVLCEELSGTHINVRVRFSCGRLRPSGVMRAAESVAPEAPRRWGKA